MKSLPYDYKMLSKIERIANEILESYEARLFKHDLEESPLDEDEWYGLDIYITGVTIETVSKMNMDLAKKLSEIDENEGQIIPIFILVEHEEDSCHGDL